MKLSIESFVGVGRRFLDMNFNGFKGRFKINLEGMVCYYTRRGHVSSERLSFSFGTLFF